MKTKNKRLKLLARQAQFDKTDPNDKRGQNRPGSQKK